MSRRFGSINNSFTDAGVHYMVLKGFSLVPQFCPFAPLRHQGDLDYLVAEQSLSAACHVLSNAGYTPQRSRSGVESIFVSRGGGPSRGGRQYSSQSPHAVELHTDIWDSRMHRVAPIPSLFSVAQAGTRHWNGIMFPAQKDEDAFLLQVLHACHHFFTQWIRMSCLYEIGYFLHQRASDSELWSGIEQRAGDSAVLREFVVIVTELVAQLFAVPVPDLVQSWGARIRSGPRVWTEYYARKWALGGLPVYEFNLFPRAKLALFLHQQYRVSSRPQESRRPAKSSFSRVSRIVSSIKKDPSLALSPSWWNRQHLFRRAMFHGLASLRYICEIPRWRWRNRTHLRTTSSPWTADSLPAKKAS
jgi:putative nucleotidyltransferase-like protein